MYRDKRERTALEVVVAEFLRRDCASVVAEYLYPCCARKWCCEYSTRLDSACCWCGDKRTFVSHDPRDPRQDVHYFETPGPRCAGDHVKRTKHYCTGCKEWEPDPYHWEPDPPPRPPTPPPPLPPPPAPTICTMGFRLYGQPSADGTVHRYMVPMRYTAMGSGYTIAEAMGPPQRVTSQELEQLPPYEPVHQVAVVPSSIVVVAPSFNVSVISGGVSSIRWSS